MTSTGATSINVKKDLWAGNSYAANMNSWWSAEEAAETAKLTYRDHIVPAIHATTQAYRGLVTAKLTLKRQSKLDNDIEQLKDAKLKLKLGRGTIRCKPIKTRCRQRQKHHYYRRADCAL